MVVVTTGNGDAAEGTASRSRTPHPCRLLRPSLLSTALPQRAAVATHTDASTLREYSASSNHMDDI